MARPIKKLKRSHSGEPSTNGLEIEESDEDEKYFRGYAFLQTHQNMVSDFVRTNAYRHSILRSYESLYKKTVLEIGCGTGILSIFACQAGVQKVYAVDASEMIRHAEKIVAKNGQSEKIALVHSKIEDFVLPNDEKVDAIISEWMGHCLFYEWMLPSVISTRDRLLKENGLLFPNKVKVFMALVQETDYMKSRVSYWLTDPQKQYNVDMSILAEEDCKEMRGRMSVHVVEPIDIASASCELMTLDLRTIKLEDCERFTADFNLTAFGTFDIHGFCIWFQTFFPGDVDLNTSPFSTETHWAQTTLYVSPFAVKQDNVISGSITFERHPKSRRELAVDLKYALDQGEAKEVRFLDLDFN